MKNNTKDPNKPVGKMVRIHDFLPAPGKLVMPEETVKVTMALSKSSIVFFKQQAKKHHTKYQKMIRTVVDTYTAHYMHHP